MKHLDKSDNSLKVRRDSNSRRTSLAELIPDWPVLSKRTRSTKVIKNLSYTTKTNHGVLLFKTNITN